MVNWSCHWISGLLPTRDRPVAPLAAVASTDSGCTSKLVVPSAPPAVAPPSAGRSQISKPACTDDNHQDGETHSPAAVPSAWAGHVAFRVAARAGRAAVL